MRIIAGTLGGRTLHIPGNTAFRPTTDRVREALFSILGSRMDINASIVCDLFAGSGSLGIEALSRGAAFTQFVESGRDIVTVLRNNLQLLALENRSNVIHSSVESWITQSNTSFNLVFADPPYDYYNYLTLIAGIANILADPSAMAVIEHRSDITLPEHPLLKVKLLRNYGKTSLSFLSMSAGGQL